MASIKAFFTSFFTSSTAKIIRDDTVLTTKSREWAAFINKDIPSQDVLDLLSSYVLSKSFKLAERKKSQLAVVQDQLELLVGTETARNKRRFMEFRIAINDKNERLIYCSWKDEYDPTFLYFDTLFEELAEYLAQCTVFRSQKFDPSVIESKKEDTIQSQLRASTVTEDSQKLIDRNAVYDEAQKIGAIFVNDEHPREDLLKFFVDHAKAYSIVCTVDGKATVNGSSDSLSITMKIGFNEKNERLLHLINQVSSTAGDIHTIHFTIPYSLSHGENVKQFMKTFAKYLLDRKALAGQTKNTQFPSGLTRVTVQRKPLDAIQGEQRLKQEEEKQIFEEQRKIQEQLKKKEEESIQFEKQREAENQLKQEEEWKKEEEARIKTEQEEERKKQEEETQRKTREKEERRKQSEMKRLEDEQKRKQEEEVQKRQEERIRQENEARVKAEQQTKRLEEERLREEERIKAQREEEERKRKQEEIQQQQEEEQQKRLEEEQERKRQEHEVQRKVEEERKRKEEEEIQRKLQEEEQLRSKQEEQERIQAEQELKRKQELMVEERIQQEEHEPQVQEEQDDEDVAQEEQEQLSSQESTQPSIAAQTNTQPATPKKKQKKKKNKKKAAQPIVQQTKQPEQNIDDETY